MAGFSGILKQNSFGEFLLWRVLIFLDWSGEGWRDILSELFRFGLDKLSFGESILFFETSFCLSFLTSLIELILELQ